MIYFMNRVHSLPFSLVPTVFTLRLSSLSMNYISHYASCSHFFFSQTVFHTDLDPFTHGSHILVSNFIFPRHYQCCSPTPRFESYEFPSNPLRLFSIFPNTKVCIQNYCLLTIFWSWNSNRIALRKDICSCKTLVYCPCYYVRLAFFIVRYCTHSLGRVKHTHTLIFRFYFRSFSYGILSIHCPFSPN